MTKNVGRQYLVLVTLYHGLQLVLARQLELVALKNALDWGLVLPIHVLLGTRVNGPLFRGTLF